MLNWHYLNELEHEIRKTWACREDTGNRRVYVGTKKGVYFFAGDFVVEGEIVSLVKIGKAGDVSARKKQYYTGNPSSLYLIYFHKAFDAKERGEIEKNYHYKFIEHRFRKNREWFYLKPVALALGLDWEKMNER